MRGSSIPFDITDDLSATPAAHKIPLADVNGVIDSGWFSITPPAGGITVYGIVDHPLPNLSSSVAAIGYDPDPGIDQVFIWNGSRWVTIAG